MNVVVTGCAGFIGSQLVETLLSRGKRVIGIDNFSTGQRAFLESAIKNPLFEFYEIDLLQDNNLHKLFEKVEIVYHFAANADVRFGAIHPTRDTEQNLLVTQNVLEAMRISKVNKIVFSSTGSIYGESQMIPTPEDAPIPIQTSLYGASKLACEALIQAYCETFEMQSWIFRFVSILGPRYTHGHVLDFFNQLKLHPNYLNVLGNGHQRKSYLHVSDCINAIDIATIKSNCKVNIFNLGIDDTCNVIESVNWICEKMGLNPEVNYGLKNKGWIGDNPVIHLSTERISNLGWTPKYSIKQSIQSTLDFLTENDQIS